MAFSKRTCVRLAALTAVALPNTGGVHAAQALVDAFKRRTIDPSCNCYS